MSILGRTIEAALRMYHNALENRKSIYAARDDNAEFKSYPKTPLTKEEKKLINAKWGGVVDCVPRGYGFFAGMKSLYSFDPNYFPSAYYYPHIMNILNPQQWAGLLSHKSLMELIYANGIKHPNTVLRSYGGLYFDGNYKPLLRHEAIQKVKACGTPLLFKPATGSCLGRGIKLYKGADLDALCDEIESSRILSTSDFVLQELVEQSADTAIFSNTSLNCFRINTLNINGKVSVCTRTIKCGPKDSIVDNIGHGKQGVMVGLDADGNLYDTGFYGNGEKTTTHNGVSFGGRKICAFQKVIDAVLQLHEYVPMPKLIGWDIALDASDEPVLIEANVGYPGLMITQITCGTPEFGERTDEFIEFIKSQKKEFRL